MREARVGGRLLLCRSSGCYSAALVAVFFACLPIVSEAANFPSAPDRSVFGLQIGAKFALPACPGAGHEFDNHPMCQAHRYFHRDIGATSYEVDFPAEGVTDTTPSWVFDLVDGTLRVWTIDGRIEGVDFGTHGAAAQAEALQALTAKWGSPTAQDVTHLQNAFGAHFDGITATWRFSDLNIDFIGIQDLLDGEVRVYSQLLKSRRDAAAKAEQQNAPHL